MSAQEDTSDRSLEEKINSMNEDAAKLNITGNLDNRSSRLMEWTTEKKVPYLLNGKSMATGFDGYTSGDTDISSANAAEAKQHFIKKLTRSGISPDAANAHAKTVAVLGQNMVSTASYGLSRHDLAIGWLSNDSLSIKPVGNNLEITAMTKGTVHDVNAEKFFDKAHNECEFSDKSIERKVVFTATYDDTKDSSTLAFKEQTCNVDLRSVAPGALSAHKELRQLLERAKNARNKPPSKRVGMITDAIKTHSDQYGLASTWSVLKGEKKGLNAHRQAAKLQQALGRPTSSWKAAMAAITQCESSTHQRDNAATKEIKKEAYKAGVQSTVESIVTNEAKIPGTTQKSEPKPEQGHTSGPNPGV